MLIVPVSGRGVPIEDIAIPLDCFYYQKQMASFVSPSYQEALRNYIESTSSLRIFDNEDYIVLLRYVHSSLQFNKTFNGASTDIIETLRRGKGVCIHFALIYFAILSLCGWKAWLLLNRTDGDHAWVEIWLNGAWVQVDPSEAIIDYPLFYHEHWGVPMNYVFAVELDHIWQVEGVYRYDGPFPQFVEPVLGLWQELSWNIRKVGMAE